jgi:hypothetical protein
MKKIINRETFKNFTKINNTNYTNNTNCINDTNDNNDCLRAIQEKESVTPAASSGLAPEVLSASPCSQPGEVICSGVGNSAAPRNWRGVKFDLFNTNPGFKLKVGVIKNDGTTQELIAALNSPASYIWRNVSNQDRATSHWLAVQALEDELKQANIPYRASKLATPRKGSSTELVVFLIEQPTGWQVNLIMKGAIYDYQLLRNANLSPAQLSNNMLSTLFVGKTQTKLLSVEDLGL